MAPTPTRSVTAPPRRALDAFEGGAHVGLVLLEAAGDDPLLFVGHRGDGDREPRRCRTHPCPLPEPDALRFLLEFEPPARGRIVRVGDRPAERAQQLIPVYERGGLPLPQRGVVVAAPEAGADRRRVIQPIGAEKLGREPRRHVDVSHQLPHPLDRRVDQNVNLDGGAVPVLQRPPLFSGRRLNPGMLATLTTPRRRMAVWIHETFLASTEFLESRVGVDRALPGYREHSTRATSADSTTTGAQTAARRPILRRPLGRTTRGCRIVPLSCPWSGWRDSNRDLLTPGRFGDHRSGVEFGADPFSQVRWDPVVQMELREPPRRGNFLVEFLVGFVADSDHVALDFEARETHPSPGFGHGRRSIIDTSSSREPKPSRQLQEFLRLSGHDSTLGLTGHGDTSPTAELQHVFFSQHAKCAEHGVRMHTEHRGHVTCGWKPLAWSYFALCDLTADLSRDLFMQRE